MFHHLRRALVPFLLLAIGAQAEDATPEPSRTWSLSVALGVTANRGNSDNTTATAGILAEGKTEERELRAGGDIAYGESDDKTDTNNGKLFAEYRELLGSRNYALANLSALYDRQADISYRVTVALGLGHYFIKGERSLFSVDIGPAGVFERVGGEDDQFASLRIGQRAELKTSETSKVWEEVEYLPDVSDFDRYLFNAEVGAEASVTTHIKLRIVLKNSYNSRPAADHDENDLSIIGSLVWTL